MQNPTRSRAHRTMRMLSLVVVLIVGLLVLIRPAMSRGPHAASASGGSGGVAVVDNGWDASHFDYMRSTTPRVQFATPTEAQVSFVGRPPIDTSAPVVPHEPSDAMPAPVTIAGIDFLHLRFRNAAGEVVPMLLGTPTGKAGPFPLVLAVHGLHSNKAQVIGQLGPGLVKRGYAVLAPDMPWHGERPGNSRDVRDNAKIWDRFAVYKKSVIDVRQAIDVAERLSQVDVSAGVTFAGYSMGAFIGSVAGPADPRINAMVLLVGGAMEISGWLTKLPQVAAVDGRLAIAHFTGRPLLFLNATRDECITRAMTDVLWAVAPEPKQQRWYDAGHLLPKQAYDDAAAWIATVNVPRRELARGD